MLYGIQLIAYQHQKWNKAGHAGSAAVSKRTEFHLPLSLREAQTLRTCDSAQSPDTEGGGHVCDGP